MNKFILPESDRIRELEMRVKLAEAQRDVAIAEKELAFLSTKTLTSPKTDAAAIHRAKDNTVLSRVLTALQNDEMSTDELAVRCHTTLQTLGVTLSRAKNKGLVEMSKHQSSRYGFWALTKKGHLEKSYILN